MLENPVQTSSPSAQEPSFDVDAAMANIEQHGDASGPASSEPQQQVQPQQQVIEYEYDAAGKKIKEPIDMILKRASQGYHYAQRMAEIKAQEAKYKQYEDQNKTLQQWKEYDDYAKQNPAWAEHVHAMWEKRQEALESAGADNPNSPLHAELQALKAELNPIKEFVGSLRQAEEDKALSSEIESIRKKYADLDFDQADESGKSLEYRVLEHAKENGIKSFKLAFLDLYHDKVLQTREEKAKEAAIKAQQNQRKQGILGQSSQPTKGIRPAGNSKSKSYDDLAREALDELGIAH